MSVTLKYHCPFDDCGEEIDIEAEVEEGDDWAGSDADGNRGIYIGPAVMPPDAPDKCDACEKKYSKEQKAIIERDLENRAADFEVVDNNPNDP